MAEARPCELCGRKHGRRAAIWIKGRGNLIVCIRCADEQDALTQPAARPSSSQ